MYELLIVAGFGTLGILSTRLHHDEISEVSRKVGDRMGKLWDIAHQGMRENRFFARRKGIAYHT